MTIFFIQFEATPRRDSRVGPGIGGAFINCWIDRPELAAAIHAARAVVEREGWIVDEPEAAYEVDDSDYPRGSDGHDFFQQALTDGEVCVIHTFPDVWDAGDHQ